MPEIDPGKRRASSEIKIVNLARQNFNTLP